ncbi:MAG: glycosyltransferase family 39 protein [Desulfobacterales bacterium]|nr:glycosyltransferase family 39 protein [Desulfobacterales bacterium]
MTSFFPRLSIQRYFEHWWAKLALLVILSLCFKLWVFLRVDVINPDGVLYLKAARYYLSGDFAAALDLYPMPFYPLLIAAVHWLFVPNLVLAGQVLSIFFLTGMLVPCYLLVREAWNDTAAFWGGALLATSPYFNRDASEIMRDPAFLFFLAWATWATYRLLKTKDWRWAALASLMATLATLSRIEGAFLFLALPVGYLLGSRGLSIGRRIGMLAILILTGPVCIAPLAAWVTFRWGELPGSRFPELLLVKHNLSLVVEKYRLYYEMLRTLEHQLPDGGDSHNFFALTRHYIPFIYLIGLAHSLVRVVHPAVFIASLAGLKTWRHVPSSFRWISGSVFCSYLLLAMLLRFQDAWYSNRFIYTPALILTLWAGQGVVVIWRWQQERWQRGWSRWVATTTILALLLSPAVKAFMCRHGRENNIRQAGLWLSCHSPVGAHLLTNDSRIAFYADREFATVDIHGDINKLPLQHECSYIVLRGTTHEVAQLPAPAGYEEVQRFPGKHKIVVIFRDRGF